MSKIIKNKEINSNNILENPIIIEWIKNGPYFQNLYEKSRKGSKKNKEKSIIEEREWGNSMIKEYCNSKKKTSQWTTKLSEYIVKKILEKNGENVNKPKKINGLKPDWETDKCIYEVKSRSYTITGTAGEKILGVPWKYASISRLYNKPLKIILVAYQEQEAIKKFNIFEPDKEQKKIMNFWKTLDIEYIKASDLL